MYIGIHFYPTSFYYILVLLTELRYTYNNGQTSFIALSIPRKGDGSRSEKKVSILIMVYIYLATRFCPRELNLFNVRISAS